MRRRRSIVHGSGARSVTICGAAVLTAVMWLATPVSAQQLIWTGSLGYLDGTYGTDESTRTLVFVNAVTLGAEPWSLTLELPVFDVDGPATRFAGGRPLPPRTGSGGDEPGPGPGPGDPGGGGGDGGGGDGGGGGGNGGGGDDGSVTEPEPLDTTGVGDPLLRFHLDLIGGDADLGVFASVKIPLNDVDRAYATGEWDAGAGLTFGGPIGGFYGRGEAGYWMLGDPPDGELEDPWVLRLELGRRFGSWWGVLAADAAGETVPGFGTAVMVEAIVRRSVAARTVLGCVVAVGLTDAAPDIYVALEWQLGG